MARSGRPGATVRVRVQESIDERVTAHEDQLATEEPLEIRLTWPGAPAQRVVVTMRTPGADFELAAGLLFGEGLIDGDGHVRSVSYCTDPSLSFEQHYNVVTVALRRPPRMSPAARFSQVSAACGVCGKQSLDDLDTAGMAPVRSTVLVEPEVVTELPTRLRAGQAVFASTGGLHAAGVYDFAGAELVVREDIGRHNVVDKVVGHALLAGRPSLAEHLLCVSGRIGFEIVQKAVAAQLAMIVAVGAPSSLAVQTAQRFGVTLAGFVRDGRFVLYAEPGRVRTGRPV